MDGVGSAGAGRGFATSMTLTNCGPGNRTHAHNTPSREDVLSEPVSLSVDKFNNVYVLDRIANNVVIFDENGSIIRKIYQGNKQLLHPEGVFVDENNQLLIADTGNGRIINTALDGTILNIYGSKGMLPGQYNNPSGVCRDPVSKNIIVTDKQNNRIQILDASGNYLSEYGTQGELPEQFNQPYETIVGKDRNMFTTDTINNRVIWRLAFDPLNIISLIMYDESNREIFKHPHGIAFDSQESKIFIADTGNNRIVSIDIKEANDIILPRAMITHPISDQSVGDTVNINGIAADAYFSHYGLDYGIGENPGEFIVIKESNIPVWNDTIGEWNTSGLVNGRYTLRLVVTDESNNINEARVYVNVNNTPGRLYSYIDTLKSFLK